MLNGARPFFTRLMTPVGEALARTPITPNMITVTGTVGLCAGVLWGYPTGHLFWGTVVATFFVFTDMLDGVLARLKGTSGKFGAFLDSTMDRVADAAVFSGLAIWFVLGGHSRLMAVVSLFCLVAGALVSYVKARAEGLGTTANVGIAERPERLVLTFTVTGLWGLGVPYILPAGLWVLAVASVITLFQRIVAVHKGLAVPPPSPDAAVPPPPGGQAAETKAAETKAAETKAAETKADTGSAAAAHTTE